MAWDVAHGVVVGVSVVFCWDSRSDVDCFDSVELFARICVVSPAFVSRGVVRCAVPDFHATAARTARVEHDVVPRWHF